MRKKAEALRAIVGFPSVTTIFKTSSGEEVTVASFTYSKEELRDMLDQAGLEVLSLQTAHAGELLSHGGPISPAISLVSEVLDISMEELPILYLVKARIKRVHPIEPLG